MRGGASGGRWWGLGEDAGEQQIPFGNDNKKGKGKGNSKGKGNGRFPSGMSIACGGRAFARWRFRWSRVGDG